MNSGSDGLLSLDALNVDYPLLSVNTDYFADLLTFVMSTNNLRKWKFVTKIKMRIPSYY